MAGARGCREDLAYVHDAGFRDYALTARVKSHGRLKAAPLAPQVVDP